MFFGKIEVIITSLLILFSSYESGKTDGESPARQNKNDFGPKQKACGYQLSIPRD
jgi:hypothetical protein